MSGHTSIRVCGDYSVTVNPQLEMHRHPMPQPEDLMRRLGRGHSFTKIGLADAYNQICLGPESQKKLALSTHMGVLLQKETAFWNNLCPWLVPRNCGPADTRSSQRCGVLG